MKHPETVSSPISTEEFIESLVDLKIKIKLFTVGKTVIDNVELRKI